VSGVSGLFPHGNEDEDKIVGDREGRDDLWGERDGEVVVVSYPSLFPSPFLYLYLLTYPRRKVEDLMI
jgi:hypothetical protein